MVREFDVRPIEPSVVERILANGLQGPSAGFAQGFDLLVLQGPDQTARFWTASKATDAGRQRWSGIANAPLVIVLFPDEHAYRRRFSAPDKTAGLEVPWWLVDTSFAAMILLHSAVDADLGAVFFRVNDPAAVSKEFGVPDSRVPLGAVAIGHPRESRPSLSVARGRRPIDEMVHRGDW
jgi:nitroreductase